MPTLYQWKKTCPMHRAQDWLEKIAPAVPPDRLAVVTPVSGRTQSFQAYLQRESEAAELKQRFGGKVSKVKDTDWMGPASNATRKPLAFSGNLLVTGKPEGIPKLKAKNPGKHVLAIPAAMAFGTGEHATTAMCLRLLGELGKRREPWTMLDLGCGSGILALAARLFGADRAEGWDHDPHAVRTARENAKLNSAQRVTIRRVDLVKGTWPTDKTQGWPVVAANLFSELLISILPKVTTLICPSGNLVASGILASQGAEVEQAFAANGFRVITKRRRGRWLAYLAEKPHDAG